jgi:hypothetical protein
MSQAGPKNGQSTRKASNIKRLQKKTGRGPHLSKCFIKTECKGDRFAPTRFGENVEQAPN